MTRRHTLFGSLLAVALTIGMFAAVGPATGLLGPNLVAEAAAAAPAGQANAKVEKAKKKVANKKQKVANKSA